MLAGSLIETRGVIAISVSQITIGMGRFINPDGSRTLRRLVPSLLALSAAGCVSQSTDGDLVSFHYAWWVTLGLLGGGFLAIPVGLLVRKRFARAGWTLVAAGPVVALLFAPSMYRERVQVSPDGLDVRSGFLGLTACQTVRFDGLRQIHIGQEITRGRAARAIDTLLFEWEDGGSARLPLNNDVKVAAAPLILRYTAAKRVRIVHTR
jgi:hypothetical protein